MIHIAYGIDDKYLPCLIVSMFTALREVSEPTTITIFTAGPEFDTSPIHVLAKNFENATFEFRRFDTSSLATYGKTEVATRFPAASMLPLFLPQMVEGRCLFIDADTLILDDIAQLFKTDLKGNLIGASRSYAAALSIRRAFHRGFLFPLIYKNRKERFRKKSSRLGYSTISEFEKKYFSSGVILLDTDAIRAADPSNALASVDSSEELWVNGLTLPDMDRLNQFFKDRVHYFDLKWDVPRDVSSLNKLYAQPDLWSEIVAAIEDPSILHYSDIYMRKSWNRPWYAGSRYRLYRRTCESIRTQTGIDVSGMFDARARAASS